MIPMTTARAAAPNLGGRANTRGRAVVATSQSPTFTAAIRSHGAACLLGDFFFAPVPSVCRVCQSAKNPLDLGPVDSGCGPVPKRGANFNAPPRTTTLATGNYGNGWRNFNAVSNAERPLHGCPVGYRENTGCCGSVQYTVLSTPFARALLTKALAGTRWSAMTAPIYCRSRRACGGPVPALAGSLLQP